MLTETALNRALRAQPQRAQALLFALDDMARRDQPLTQACDAQLFARQARAAGVVETLRQLVQFGLSAAQLLGRVDQPPRQVIQPLHLAVLPARVMMVELAGQVIQLLQ